MQRHLISTALHHQHVLTSPLRPRLAPLSRSPFASTSFTLTMAFNNASFKLPKIANEPNLHYKVDSPERAALKKELAALEAAAPFYVPAVVGGKEVRYTTARPIASRKTDPLYCPSDPQVWRADQSAHAPQEGVDPRHLLHVVERARRRGHRVCSQCQVRVGGHALQRPCRHLPQGESLQLCERVGL